MTSKKKKKRGVARGTIESHRPARTLEGLPSVAFFFYMFRVERIRAGSSSGAFRPAGCILRPEGGRGVGRAGGRGAMWSAVFLLKNLAARVGELTFRDDQRCDAIAGV